MRPKSADPVAFSTTADAQAPAIEPFKTARVPVSVVAATVVGNALEYYDFLTYAFFAVYIGRTFFPSSTPFLSLLLSLAVFGVGFFFRPLGGILIGTYADRAGRRPAMLLTIVLITVGTIGLALTPSYATIGIAAPLVVVFCRLVQGLALGGEIGPATAFLIEIAPTGRRGLYTSWQTASQGAAALVAGALGVALSLGLSQAELAAWGWRIPFLLGLGLLPVAVYLRRAMPETSHQEVSAGSSAPRVRVGHHARLIVLAILVIMGGTVAAYVSTYMTTYAIAVLKFPPSIALSATVVSGLAILVFALVGGWLSDRYGRRLVMLVPRILTAIVTYPLFLLLVKLPNSGILFLATAVIALLAATSTAVSLVAISESLPNRTRATGLAIAYSVSITLFGGGTQFVITYLIGVTGDPTSPAWFLTLTSVVSALAMWALPENSSRALED